MDDKKDIKRIFFQTKWFGLFIGFIIFIVFLGLTYGIGLINNIERNLVDLNFNAKFDILFNTYGTKKNQEGVITIQYNPKVSKDITLIGIDNLTLDEFGKWPFSRSVHANLINTFTRIQDQKKRERALFLDINFIERDLETPENDVLLIDSIKENNKVYLEAFFSQSEYKKDIAEQNLGRLRFFIDKFGVITANQISGDWKKLLQWKSVECPLKPYINVAHGYGNVTFVPDPDQVFRRQPLISNFSEQIAEIKLSDLTINEQLDQKSFEYLQWEDTEGKRHDIAYPLTEAALKNLREEMEESAPPREEDTDGDGKIDSRSYVVRKYHDFLIPSITLNLALDYFNKTLPDIEVVLGKYIRIPDPQKYDPETGEWHNAIEKSAVYEYPKVFEQEVFENEILGKAGEEYAQVLNDSYELNVLFNKYILRDMLEDEQLRTLEETLLKIGYQGIKLIKPEMVKKEILIPIDDRGRMLINYMGKPSSTAMDGHQTYRIKSFIRNINDPGPDPENFSRIARNANSIVIVGMFATGLGDEKTTPYGIMYGPEVNANAINTIVMDNFLRTAPWYLNVFILFAFVMIISLLATRLPTIISLAISLFLGVSYFFTCSIIFDIMNLSIIISAPIIAGILTFISIVTYRVMTEEKDKKRIKNMFGKYVSPTVVDSLLLHPPELGGVDKELTVLFSDIRGFTSLSERMTPQALVNHLNEYLTAMTDLILEYRGTLDKYVGDEVMCFWGAPLPEPDHALLSCMCALKQMEVLRKLNENWPEEKRIDIGIGINSGIMTVGNMGSPGRMNYTLMGDNVNLGARLEGTNKQYFTNIIISEYTYGLVKDKVIVRELDNLRVKGKNKPVLIYELVDMVDTYELSADKKIVLEK